MTPADKDEVIATLYDHLKESADIVREVLEKSNLDPEAQKALYRILDKWAFVSCVLFDGEEPTRER